MRRRPLPFAHGALVGLLAALFLGGVGGLPLARSEAPRAGGEAPLEAPTSTACPVCGRAEALGLHMTPLMPVPRTRCPCPRAPAARPLAPCGRVTPADLRTLELEIGDAWFDDPALAAGEPLRLAFRVGAATLGTLELEAGDVGDPRVHVALPSELRARFQGIRGEIRWGRLVDGEIQRPRSFRLEAPSSRARDRLAQVARAVRDAPPWIAALLRAQAALDTGYEQAALREARAALALRPGEPHALALLAALQHLLGRGCSEEWLDTVRRTDTLRERRARTLHGRCRLDERPRKEVRWRMESAPRGGCGAYHAESPARR